MSISILIDIAVVGICFLMYASYKRKGLVAVVLQLVALLAAIVCAWAIPPIFANGIYDIFLKNDTISYFERAINSEDFERQINNIEETIGSENINVGETLRFFSVSDEHMETTRKLMGLAGIDIDQNISVSELFIPYNIEEQVAKPVLLFVVRSGLSLTVFLVSLAIFNFIVRQTRIINKIPLIGGINASLGGAIGLCVAIISIYTVMLLSSIVLSMSPEKTKESAEMIKNSFTYRVLSEVPVPVAQKYFVL